MLLSKPLIFSRYGEFPVPASLISLINKSSFKSLNTLILLVILPIVVNTVSKTRVSLRNEGLHFLESRFLVYGTDCNMRMKRDIRKKYFIVIYLQSKDRKRIERKIILKK